MVSALLAAIAMQAVAKAPSEPSPVAEFSYIQSRTILWTPRRAPRSTFCNCIEYAKAVTGHSGTSWGWARAIVPNADDPRPGDVLLTYEGGGHAAVIVAVDEDTVAIQEGNYASCSETFRSLVRADPRIRGIFRP